MNGRGDITMHSAAQAIERIGATLGGACIACMLIIYSFAAQGSNVDFALDDNLGLGVGYDSLGSNARGDCIIHKETDKQKAQDLVYYMNTVENSEDLKDALGVSASASLKGGLWGVKSKASFVDSFSMNAYSLHVFVMISVTNSRERLLGVEFKDDALELLLNGNTERFRERCGDEFVRSRTTGGELFGLLTIQTSTEEEKQEISADMEGSLGIFSSKGEFSDKFLKITESNKTELVMSISGGTEIKVPKNMAELISAATDFPSKVRDEQGALLIAHTQDYDVLSRKNQNVSFVDISQQNAVIEDLAEVLDEVNLQLANVKYIRTYPAQFDGVDLSLMADARRLLLKDKNTIRDVVRACYDREDGCRVPTDLTVYNLDLPKRREGPTQAGTEEARILAIALGRKFDPAYQDDPNGWTDLHYAAVLDDVTLAENLLRNGARIRSSLKPTGRFTQPLKEKLALLGYNIENDRRILQTPIHIAAQANANRVIALLGGEDAAVIALKDGLGRTPLHYAAAANSAKAIDELDARNSDVINHGDRSGKTALHLAAQSNAEEAIRALLRNPDIDPNLVDDRGYTALRTAINARSAEAVEALLGHSRVNVWAIDKRGRSVLHHAVWEESPRIVEALLQGVSHGDRILDAPDKDMSRALHFAAQTKNKNGTEKPMKITRALLLKGANVNVRDERNETPLHYAAKNDLPGVVTALLDHGAWTNARGDDQETPLHRALRRSSYGAARILTERGADPNLPGRKNRRPLHYVAEMDKANLVDLLIRNGASVTTVDNNGATALHYAARSNSVNAMERLLLEPTIRIGARTRRGNTALHSAAANDSTQAAEMLLDRGVGLINSRNNAGRTPLHLAASDHSVNAMAVLIGTNGISLNALDKDRESPLHHAADARADAAVALLLGTNRVTIDLPDEDGNTPLHVAARRRAGSIVERLLEAGADPQLTNEDGLSPVNYISTRFTGDERSRLMRMVR